MKIFLTVLMCLLSFQAHAVTVISINTEFFWDSVEPHEGRIVGFGEGEKIKPPTASEFAIEAYAYAKTIEAAGADIAGLVEIENENVARAVLQYLTPNWHLVFLQGRDKHTGQDVALLTRLKVVANSVSNFENRAASANTKKPSKIIAAKLTDGENSFFVIVTHFISKTGSYDAKRKAQAQFVRKILDEKFNDSDHVIVMGDLNDTPNSPPLKKLKGTGKKRLLQIADTSSRSDDYSYVYKNKKQLIDHILVSPSLKTDQADFYAITLPEGLTDHRSVVFHN